VIVDRAGTLVAANAAFAVITAGAAPELLAPPVNVARLFLHPEGIAPRILNLGEWAWHIVDRLREAALRNPDDRLAALVEELTPYAGERSAGAAHVGFAVPLRLRSGDDELHLLTTLAHFGTAVDVTVAELRLEAFLPADAATAELLGSLALPA
jgi:hypothetical protein